MFFIIQSQNRSMAEKSAKSQLEVSDVNERSGIVTRERNLPRCGIRTIKPKFPVKASSRQSRTEENFEASESNAEDEYYKGVPEGTERS